MLLPPLPIFHISCQKFLGFKFYRFEELMPITLSIAVLGDISMWQSCKFGALLKSCHKFENGQILWYKHAYPPATVLQLDVGVINDSARAYYRVLARHDPKSNEGLSLTLRTEHGERPSDK